MSWLLDRIQAKEHDENRGYAAEILAILLQDDKDNKLEFGKKDGVEILLKTLSVRSSIDSLPVQSKC
jgi:beta-catenin-like protein 1